MPDSGVSSATQFLVFNLSNYKLNRGVAEQANFQRPSPLKSCGWMLIQDCQFPKLNDKICKTLKKL